MTFVDTDHPRAAAGRFTAKHQSAPDAQLASIETATITWQHPVTEKVSDVGVLSFDGSVYRFVYLPAARDVDGFRPLLAFHDLERAYESQHLFPLFKQRTMNPARQDFDDYVRSIGLEGEPTPWQQLRASGGGSQGDTLGVVAG